MDEIRSVVKPLVWREVIVPSENFYGLWTGEGLTGLYKIRSKSSNVLWYVERPSDRGPVDYIERSLEDAKAFAQADYDRDILGALDLSGIASAFDMARRCIESLMPGIRYIAVQDYSLINEAPIAVKQAFAATKRTEG